MRSEAHRDTSGQSTDRFHNGRELLPCITQHHAFLSKSIPPYDPLTKGVLNMVTEHMLVDKLERCPAGKLSSKATQMHHQHRRMRSQSSVASPRISSTSSELHYPHRLSAPRSHVHSESSGDWSLESPSSPPYRPPLEQSQPFFDGDAKRSGMAPSPSKRSVFPQFTVENARWRREHRILLPSNHTRDLRNRDFVSFTYISLRRCALTFLGVPS